MHDSLDLPQAAAVNPVRDEPHRVAASPGGAATADPTAPARASARESEGEPARPRLTREERLALEHERLLAAVASGKTVRLQERVAWILHRQPHTRNSDAALQLAYWQEYETEIYEEFKADPERNYKKLTRLTSIARARAKIQNQHHLFLASPEVRKRRGQLSEEERERHATEIPPSPLITVFADESGKTDQNLVVGSVWLIDARDTFHIAGRVLDWRVSTGFDAELHFSEITRDTLPRYIAFVELVLSDAPLISFKSISVPRAGIRAPDGAFEVLFYELLRQGLRHEHETGRAPMPRRLVFWKDEETEGRGRDLLILARLRESLAGASGVHFGGQLAIDACEALNSTHHPLLQLADLYTGSINRTLSRDRTSTKPKDVFADHLLERVRGLPGDELAQRMTVGAEGDAEVCLRL